MAAETKRCPYCKEEILADAIRCKHCHMMLDKEPSVSDGSDVAAAGPLDDAATRLPDDVGRVLSGRFEIKELIAEGGFGKVYRAYDRVMKIDVAIKELSDRFEKDRKAVRFLLSEAKAAHALAHPRIAKFDYYDEKGKYLLMEYVPGLVVGETVCHDVAQLLEARGGKLSEEEATRIILQLLEALQYAHGLPEPVIHRDIKPQNLLLDAQGNVKVCDFGIAKVVRESVSRYGIPDTSGTLMYMSPEQCVGRGVDARSDIYSLGVTLYELLSGRTPFEDAEDVTYCHINVEPEPIRGVSGRLNEIILKCLAKKPEDRWQNARELADALEGRIETDSERREKERARAALRKQEEERKQREKEEAERKAKEEATRQRELEESRRLGEEEERRQREAVRRLDFPSVGHEEAAREFEEEKRRKEAERKAREEEEEREKNRAVVVVLALIFFLAVAVIGGIYYQGRVREEGERALREAAGRSEQEAKQKQAETEKTTQREAVRPQPSPKPAPVVVPQPKPTASQKAAAQAPEGMVLIPAGEFMMGSLSGEGHDHEHPQHRVYVDAFYMDRYEVTVGQYKRFLSATGHRSLPDWVSEYSRTADCPVVGVSWDDAVAYARWAGKRLPTEAEWEYACRAGSATKYSFGNDEGRLGEYAWYYSNSGRKTHPVGQKKQNAWGLYDMHGNVWEWCSDWYDKDYYSNSPSRNPKGPTNGQYRVLRGGSWNNNANNARAANRNNNTPTNTNNNNGFRCARTARRNILLLAGFRQFKDCRSAH